MTNSTWKTPCLKTISGKVWWKDVIILYKHVTVTCFCGLQRVLLNCCYKFTYCSIHSFKYTNSTIVHTLDMYLVGNVLTSCQWNDMLFGLKIEAVLTLTWQQMSVWLINIFDKVPLELIIFVIYIYMFQYMYSYIFFFGKELVFLFFFSMTCIMGVVSSPDPALYPGSDVWDSSFWLF